MGPMGPGMPGMPGMPGLPALPGLPPLPTLKVPSEVVGHMQHVDDTDASCTLGCSTKKPREIAQVFQVFDVSHFL